jgi:hypothetical protein
VISESARIVISGPVPIVISGPAQIAVSDDAPIVVSSPTVPPDQDAPATARLKKKKKVPKHHPAENQASPDPERVLVLDGAPAGAGVEILSVAPAREPPSNPAVQIPFPPSGLPEQGPPAPAIQALPVAAPPADDEALAVHQGPAALSGPPRGPPGTAPVQGDRRDAGLPPPASPGSFGDFRSEPAPAPQRGARDRTSTMTPAAPRSTSPKPAAEQLAPASAGARQRTSTMTPAAPAGAAQGPASAAPKLINRAFSVPEIVHLAFGLRPVFTKVELLDALNQYKIEDFAASAFRQHRAGTKLSTKMMPIEMITSFTSVPIKKPLLQVVPTALKKVSATLFDLLLQYTGVKPGYSPYQAVRQILQIIRDKPILIDECFFQLIKQTINNRNHAFLLKTWELFLIVASIYPASEDRYKWILAHIARNTTDADERISFVSTFVFLRFETRHYLGKPFDYSSDRAYIDRIPEHITRPSAYFGVLLYELMWCQRIAYPKLPIPYVLYYMIQLLKERNALRTEGIFRTPGTEGVVRDLLFTVNSEITTLARGDVNVIATLLKVWLQALPNPLVPMELLDLFEAMCGQSKYLGFVERLPQVHQLTLLYLVGFLQEVCRSAEYTGMERADLADVFGPLILNPSRAGAAPARAQRLAELSVAFCGRLIEPRDINPPLIYPLHPAYLPRPAA